MNRHLRALGLCLACIAPCIAQSSADPSQPVVDPEDAPVEATSLFGGPLQRQSFSEATLTRLDADIAASRAAFEAAPTDESAIIWYARRLGYAGRYQEALAVLTKGLESNPSSFRILRHRGHRYITVREFDKAIADLTLADQFFQTRDEIEPDGAPNRLGIPRSTLRFNILYHLGLAHYLKADFEKAHDVWTRCLIPSRRNDDMLVATTNWLVLTCKRLGHEDEAAALLAPIHRDMAVAEEGAYLALCLLHKGDITEQEAMAMAGVDENPSLPGLNNATAGYGIGMWRMLNDNDAGARQMFDRVLNGPSWGAFGFIAAEAEQVRFMHVTGSQP